MSYSATSSPTPAVEQRFNVFLVRNDLELQDPDTTGVRYHTVLFVETEADQTGYVHHVTGDLVGGMTYQRKRGDRPEDSEAFHNKDLLGTVSASQYLAAFDAICAAQPAPPRQKAYNPQTNRTEPFKADRTFYRSGEQRRPLTKCTEWTERQAIPALRQLGLIRQ